MSTVILIVLILLLVSRAERQIRGRRAHTTLDRPWLLSDIATEAHRQLGDRILIDVCDIADASGARVVLTVRAVNAPATSLYRRHNFEVTNELDGKVAMERRPQ